MITLQRILIAVSAVVAVTAWPSCRRTQPDPSAVAQAASIAPPPAGAAGGGAIPHGDHNPHHGGVVMMKGDDLHYEVVLDRTGRAHHVYFTDAVREDLPASIASDVSLIVHRPGAAEERIALQIDDEGESWVGRGRPVETPETTSVRLSFAIRDAPYWIDLPFMTSKP